jgi:hypothetical protein
MQAAAVTVLVALTACTGVGHRSAVPSPRPSAVPSPQPPDEIPRYYVTISEDVRRLQAVVRDSASGRETGAVAIPSADHPGVASITAAADGRSFIIGAYVGGAEYTFDYRLFRLRISAAGRPAALSELQVIPLPRGTGVEGMALSPDGTRLAISLQYQEPSMDSIPYGGMEVVDLATRATRTWTAPRADYFYWPGPPSWADGDTMIAFTWWHSIGPAGMISASSTEVRELDIGAAGSDLIDSRVIVRPGRFGDLESAMITPDGKRVIAGVYQDEPASGGQRGTMMARIIEFTPGTGRVVAVPRTQTAHYAGWDERTTLIGSTQVLALDAAGEQALVQCFQLGRLGIGLVAPAYPPTRLGQFTALPGASVGNPLVAVAW